MNTTLINNIMSSYPLTSSHYLGAFPSDRIPTRIPSRCAFVVNMDKASMPGSHWFAVHINPRNIYIFDSFGTLPNPIKRWIKKLSKSHKRKRVLYNAVAHQVPDEVTCGGYAIYVLCQLGHGRRFSSLLSDFASTRYDDAFIRRYLLNTHRVNLPLTL